jgi:triacylglycerol lipase
MADSVPPSVAIQSAAVPQNPIIFCHGLFGFDTLFGLDYWNGIPETLQRAGAQVFVTKVPPTSDIRERATVLLDQINRKYAGCSVHLIGHSMGGLDSRYLVSHLMKDALFKVLSVTTVCTPHRGSPAADTLVNANGEHPVSHRSICESRR